MKNDLKCNGCMYKQVPSHFSPCLGCSHNMDRLAKDLNENIPPIRKQLNVGVQAK